MLKKQEQEYINAKSKSWEMRKSHLQALADETSRITGKPKAGIIKDLRQREKSRYEAKRIKKVVTDPHAGGLNRVVAPNPDTGIRE